MPALKEQYTPAEVIKWLQKFHGNKQFSWLNTIEPGCLFTQFVRAKTRNPDTTISLGGRIRRADGDYRDFPRLPVIPFHDLFWDKVPGKTINASRAIKILKTL